MCCVGAYLLTLGQAVYNSALAFSSCLCRAWRSARGESLGPSRLFSKHVPSPGHIHAFLESQEFVKFFKTIIPQSPSSPVIPPQSVQFVSCLPQTFEFPTPPFLRTTLIFRKLYVSLLFILQKGNRSPTRRSDFYKSVAELKDQNRGVQFLDQCSTSGLDQLGWLGENQVQVEHQY